VILTHFHYLQQIALQNQIEALQQQQQALYQQQLASNQVLSFQTPGLAPNRPAAHRRVQSTAPMGMPGSTLSSFGAPQTAMGQFGSLGTLSLGLDGQSQGVPRGHGRRHSVNVVKTPGGQGSVSYGNAYTGQEGFEDGFTSPATFGGHSRQASRADSSWRISESDLCLFFLSYSCTQ
jgi:protein SSD1